MLLAAVLLLGVMLLTLVVPPVVDSRLNGISSYSTLTISEHAKTLHRELLIIDLHADCLMWNRDLLQRNTRGHADVPRLIEGNVALQAFTIVTKVPSHMKLEGNSATTDDITLLAMAQCWPMSTWGSLLQRTLYQTDKLADFARRSGGKLTLIKSRTDLGSYLKRRTTDQSITAGFLGVEGAHALDGNLENIDIMFDHGIRMMAPTHFFDNDIGSSAHGLCDQGLTDKGKEMIRRIQKKSMIVDLAHASSRVIKDTLAISSRPCVVSHTGVKGTCNNNRNLSDEQILGIANTGGVVGIGYWSTAVCGRDARAIAKAIRYAAKRIGVTHVALGSDFDGATIAPFDASQLIQLTQALIDEGFSDSDIKLIMGKNTCRVLQECLPD